MNFKNIRFQAAAEASLQVSEYLIVPIGTFVKILHTEKEFLESAASYFQDNLSFNIEENMHFALVDPLTLIYKVTKQ